MQLTLHCNHCGRRWQQTETDDEEDEEETTADGHGANGHAGPPDAIPFYQVIVCRDCDARMKVSSTRDSIRHLKCTGCGRTVKATEQRKAA